MNAIKSKTKYTQTRSLVNVYDLYLGRQAQNLFSDGITEAVRLWFTESENDHIRQAIEELNEPGQRDRAAERLGLEIVAVN